MVISIGSLLSNMTAKLYMSLIHSFSHDKNHIHDSPLYIFLTPNTSGMSWLLLSMATTMNIVPMCFSFRWALSMTISGKKQI